LTILFLRARHFCFSFLTFWVFCLLASAHESFSRPIISIIIIIIIIKAYHFHLKGRSKATKAAAAILIGLRQKKNQKAINTTQT